VPVILLRSHTKLDSLGVEYGRLGSAVLLGGRAWRLGDGKSLEDLTQHAADALRLFGGAAIPAHFPPFVGSRSYVALNGRRIAAMLRNSRRTAARPHGSWLRCRAPASSPIGSMSRSRREWR
jgi:hypothetical protein